MRKAVLLLITTLLVGAFAASAQDVSATNVVLDAIQAEDTTNRAGSNVDAAATAASGAKLFGAYSYASGSATGKFVSFDTGPGSLLNYTVGGNPLFASVNYSGSPTPGPGLVSYTVNGDLLAIHPDNPLGAIVILGGDTGGDVTFQPARKLELAADKITVTSGKAKGVFVPANPGFTYDGGAITVNVPANGRLVFYVENADSPAAAAFKGGIGLGDMYGGIAFATVSEGAVLTQSIPIGTAILVKDLTANGGTVTLVNPGAEARRFDLFLTPETFAIAKASELNVTRNGAPVPYVAGIGDLAKATGNATVGAQAFAEISASALQISLVALPGTTEYQLVPSKEAPPIVAGVDRIAFNTTQVQKEEPPVYTDPGWWWMVAMLGGSALLIGIIVAINRNKD